MQNGPERIEDKVAWTVHRAGEARVKATLVGVLLLAVVAFGWWYAGPLLALVAVVVLFASLHTFFLPITYTMDKEGVTVDKRLFRYTYPWDRFRRWFRTTGGVVVSPFSRRTFLDNFRGVHLLLPDEPGPVIAFLERHFAPPAENNLGGESGSDAKADIEPQRHRDE